MQGASEFRLILKHVPERSADQQTRPDRRKEPAGGHVQPQRAARNEHGRARADKMATTGADIHVPPGDSLQFLAEVFDAALEPWSDAHRGPRSRKYIERITISVKVVSGSNIRDKSQNPHVR